MSGATVHDSEDFDAFTRRATGFGPYPYQRRLAVDGLPQVLRAATGSGKTLAAVLPWLYRRRVGPVEQIRRQTPRRLVVALPMRTLVEQTLAEVRGWVAALGLEVPVTQLMGGDSRRDGEWRMLPAADAILIGTIDMLLSRALNRGYAMGKGSWPIDFGLVNNDVQWVFDEVQLMGPALPTSRQLQAWRERYGTCGPAQSMWMSATIHLQELGTVDAPPPSPDDVVELDQEDRDFPHLRRRLDASRTISTLRPDETVAQAVARLHRAGTRTIVVCNTVRRAQETWATLRAGPTTEVVLVHSRFRPPERAEAIRRVLAPPGPEGTVVVTTQALEAGVDITSSCLLTELAPWSSVVQRAGRCNRYGETDDAQLVWLPTPEPAPYAAADLAAAEQTLRAHDGQALTGAALAALPVATVPEEHLVLRHKDIVELFDTAPDLSGNDIDVGRFIRDSHDVDVRIAWRQLADGKTWPQRLPAEVEAPTRNELCAVPIAAVRKAVKSKTGAPLWRFDDAADCWTRCWRADEVVPGAAYLADVTFGGYDAERGWDETVKRPVAPMRTAKSDPLTTVDAGAGADATSATGVWVRISDHLRLVGDHAAMIVGELSDQVPRGVSDAIVRAAQLHDVGKVHPVFQETMRKSAGDDERAMAESGGPWAKSSRRHHARHARSSFSHELAGALALLDPVTAHLLTDVQEDNLVRYLVAAHHGRVRLGIRSGPSETDCPDCRGPMMLGVCDGEALPGVETPLGFMPAVAMDLSPARVGGPGSWTAMALTLRDRADLGVFRLAFAEAIVRVADWRASAEEAGDR